MKLKSLLMALFLASSIPVYGDHLALNLGVAHDPSGNIVQLSATKNPNGTYSLDTIGAGTSSFTLNQSIAHDPSGGPVKLSATKNNDGTYSIATTGAGGGGGGDALTTNPLSQFAATTSLQLKGVISDETGSGALAFATSPTFVTPALGAATATSINGNTITIGTGTFTLGAVTLNAGPGGTLGTAAFTNSTAYSTGVFPNNVWVDTVSGSDSTGALKRKDLPYATIGAAFTAARAAGGNWLCDIMPGDYTSDTGLKPHSASTNIATYWEPGATWSPAGSGHLFDLTDDTFNKRLWILGHGQFTSATAVTGKFLVGLYGTTTIDSVAIEADLIVAGGTRGGNSFFDLQGTFNGAAGVMNTNYINVRQFDCRNGYANWRPASTGAAAVFYITSDFFAEQKFEEATYFISCSTAQDIFVGPNAFASPFIFLRCLNRLKATSTNALEIRRGTIALISPTYEVTDGTGSIIHFASNASAGAGAKVAVYGGKMAQWAGGSSPAILFDSVSDSNCRLRLQDVHIEMLNSAADSIHVSGAQTIEALNLSTNLALGSNITIRGGPVTVDTAFWTDF